MQLERSTKHQIASFLLIGGANTFFTLGIFQLLLFVAPMATSYLLASGIGVTISYFANQTVTFAGSGSMRKFLSFVALQITVVVAGAAFLQLVAATGISPRIAIFGVVALMTPANFVASRLILKG